MSSSDQRRSSPRRRVGGIHPGWACFLLAFTSGVSMCTASAFWYRWLEGWDRMPQAVLFTVLCLVLFWLGGRRAEKLF